MHEKRGPSLEKRPEESALQAYPRRFAVTGAMPGRRRNRILAGAVTAAAHLIIFIALLWPRHVAPPAHIKPPPPLQVSLEETPKPAPPAPPEPTMLAPKAPASAVRPSPLHMTAPMVPVTDTPDTSDILSNSQLAGATTAGEGGGGGGTCDIAQAVQQALRRDPMVRTVVEEAHRSGKAIMVWNGDWVRSGDQDGKGLSAVREAITWEVAFAPQACRNMPMHGLVLLSLADDGTRFALGAGAWRWSDLLSVHGAAPAR